MSKDNTHFTLGRKPYEGHKTSTQVLKGALFQLAKTKRVLEEQKKNIENSQRESQQKSVTSPA